MRMIGTCINPRCTTTHPKPAQLAKRWGKKPPPSLTLKAVAKRVAL